jgi:hypothetical protein
MTQILRGRFDGSKAAQRAHQPSTERYTLDTNGRRVLVGLTPAETHEFETLDSLSPSDDGGDCIAWTFGGGPTTGREKRWLQLYTRHEEAWKTFKSENGR